MTERICTRSKYK